MSEADLDLNAAWRDAQPEWACPICARNKWQIVRTAASGRRMARIVLHHDHFDDLASAEFMRAIFDAPDLTERARVRCLAQARHAIAHLRAFRPTEICQGCNHAEAEAKKAADTPKHFSFGPVDLRWICRPSPNGETLVMEERAVAAWGRRHVLYEARLYLLRPEIRRVISGSAWWEPEPAGDSPHLWQELTDALEERPGWQIPEIPSAQDRRLMAEFPALPFFTDAYLGDTLHLSLEEHGAYLKLLMIAWRSRECALPDDDRKLALMLGVSVKRWVETLRPNIAPFWHVAEGKWTQKKLSEVRKHVESVREKRKAAGEARQSTKSLNGHGPAPANAPPPAAPNAPHTRARNPNPNPKVKEANHVKTETYEAPAAPLPDAMSAVWKGLAAAEVPRSLIGRWCRDYGDGTVVEAYQAWRRAEQSGERAHAQTYIIATLNRLAGKRADDRSPMASYQRVTEKMRGGRTAEPDVSHLLALMPTGTVQ